MKSTERNITLVEQLTYQQEHPLITKSDQTGERGLCNADCNCLL